MSQPQPVPQGSGSSGCGCFGCCLGGCLGGFVMMMMAAFVLPMILWGVMVSFGPQMLVHFGDQIMKAVKDRTAKPLELPAYVPARPGLPEQVVERISRDFAQAQSQGTPFKLAASQDELNAVLRGWVKSQPDKPWAKALHDGMVTIEGGKLRTQVTLLGKGLAEALPEKLESDKPGQAPLDLTPFKNAMAQGQYLNFDATTSMSKVGETTRLKVEKFAVFGYAFEPELELEVTGQEAPPGQVEKDNEGVIRIPGFKGMGVGPAGLELEFDPKKAAEWWEKAKAEAAKSGGQGAVVGPE